MSIPILTSDSAALPERAVQSVVRQAFQQLAAGRAVQPQQVVTGLPDGGDVIAYQAVLADAGVYAVKVSPYIPQPEGTAIVTAWTLLLSTDTGQPLLLATPAASPQNAPPPPPPWPWTPWPVPAPARWPSTAWVPSGAPTCGTLAPYGTSTTSACGPARPLPLTSEGSAR
jgi:hypothetical protein